MEPCIENCSNDTSSSVPMQPSTYALIFPILLITMLCTGNLVNPLATIVFLQTSLRKQSTSVYLTFLSLTNWLFLLCSTILMLDKLQILNSYIGCPLGNFILQVTASISPWAIAAMTIERCLVVWWPLQRHRFRPRKARIVMTFVCIALTIVWTPVFTIARLGATNSTNGSVGWTCQTHLSPLYTAFRWADITITFAIPVTVITSGNIIIIFKTMMAMKWRHNPSITKERKNKNEERAQQLAKTSLVVVGGEPVYHNRSISPVLEHASVSAQSEATKSPDTLLTAVTTTTPSPTGVRHRLDLRGSLQHFSAKNRRQRALRQRNSLPGGSNNQSSILLRQNVLTKTNILISPSTQPSKRIDAIQNTCSPTIRITRDKDTTKGLLGRRRLGTCDSSRGPSSNSLHALSTAAIQKIQENRAQTRMVLVLMTISLMYLIFNGPKYCMDIYILVKIRYLPLVEATKYSSIIQIAHFLYYSQFSVHVIVYVFLHTEFRKATMRIIRNVFCCIYCREHRQRHFGPSRMAHTWSSMRSTVTRHRGPVSQPQQQHTPQLDHSLVTVPLSPNLPTGTRSHYNSTKRESPRQDNHDASTSLRRLIRFKSLQTYV